MHGGRLDPGFRRGDVRARGAGFRRGDVRTRHQAVTCSRSSFRRKPEPIRSTLIPAKAGFWIAAGGLVAALILGGILRFHAADAESRRTFDLRNPR